MTENILSDDSFSAHVDRWLPLIFKGAIEYQIPGKFDADDLVQEGLMLLHAEIKERVLSLQMWEVGSVDFEKYFKSALFHRFVDLKRTQATKKRDHKKEVHATDDYDPLANVMIADPDNPEFELISDGLYDRLMERLSEPHQRVLNCLAHPPEALLKRVREHNCPQCLYIGDPTPSGKCPLCIEAGFDHADTLVQTKSPSRVLQSEIQEYLGMKRMAISEAIYEIRAAFRSLTSTPDRITLKSFMSMFGYDEHWPMAASCRYEDGTPFLQHLTYYSLREVLNSEEVILLDFMASHSTDYYVNIHFSDLARRTGLTVHRLREAVDSIQVKLELIDAGVPLKDIPVVIG